MGRDEELKSWGWDIYWQGEWDHGELVAWGEVAVLGKGSSQGEMMGTAE